TRHRGPGVSRVWPNNPALPSGVRRGDSQHRPDGARRRSRGAGLAPQCVGRYGRPSPSAREPGDRDPLGRARDVRHFDRGVLAPGRDPERGRGIATHGPPPNRPLETRPLLPLLRTGPHQLDRPLREERPGVRLWLVLTYFAP